MSAAPTKPKKSFEPTVPARVRLPEITLKAILLGIGLAMLLGGANAYLGLFAGMTVSASIPAAVISMAVLRAFRRSNILENNIVQTAASAGESLAAGVIFTVPALVLMGYWTEFDYWQVTAIAGVGGVIGVLFTIPLRRALVVEQDLRFPEGVATAEVLKTGGIARGGDEAAVADLEDVGHDETTQRRSIQTLGLAGLAGAAMKFGESGMMAWSNPIEWGTRLFGTIWVVGLNLSPALVAVGYIVGFNIALLVFAGGALAWLIAIPVYVWNTGMPEGDVVAAANSIWSSQIRYLGVGAMVVGGLWALLNLLEPVRQGIVSGLEAYRANRESGAAVPRTEIDAPMNQVLIAIAAMAIPMLLVYQTVLENFFVAAILAAIMIVAGFFFAAIAGYMAGLVGSSNNPISGVTIATLLFAAGLLLLLTGADNPAGPAAAIFVGAMVACAAAISGDTMQDLKAGYLVGATPWRQQVMELVGVLSSAVVMAPVLYLLQARYGIGAPTPEQPEALTAPQATLMSSVATGVFQGGLPWTMVIAGGVIAAGIIALDRYLEGQGSTFRTPVLAVAVGIYLPLELSTPIFVGGLIWAGANKVRPAGSGEHSLRGLLLASGLITGEALVGILLALPIALASWSAFFGADMFRVFETPPLGGMPGLLILLAISVWLYRVACERE